MTKEQQSVSITLRSVEADDWEELAAILACDDVVYETLRLPYISRDAVRERLENAPANIHQLVAIIDDVIVGTIGLQVRRGRQAHMASLGMMVHTEYQGQGVGSALLAAAIDLAENWLNLSRIDLEVYIDNEPALKLYEKFDFEVEGTLRAYAYRDGHYADAFLMSRIRQDL